MAARAVILAGRPFLTINEFSVDHHITVVDQAALKPVA